MSRLVLFAFLFGSPLVSLWMISSVSNHLESEWAAGLAENLGTDVASLSSDATLHSICSGNGEITLSDLPKLRSACEELAYIDLIESACWAIILLSIAFLVGLRLVQAWVRKNRSRILTVFRPGIWLVNIFTIAVVIGTGAVLAGSIYYAESVFWGKIHVKIIGILGLAGLFAAWKIAKGSFSIVQPVHARIFGKAVSKSEAPELWTAVEDLSSKMNTRTPDQILIGLEPNFFVTETKVTCLNHEYTGRTLYISAPLCRILTNDELKGIIGHELAHYVGEDTRFSREFFPIYRGTNESLAALQSTSEGIAALAMLPATILVNKFLHAFDELVSEVSRERELRADNMGASVTSPKALALALIKVHIAGVLWSSIYKGIQEAGNEGKIAENLSEFFVRCYDDTEKTSLAINLSQFSTSHPTDSHPPLKDRLDNLGFYIAEIMKENLSVSGSASALNVANIQADKGTLEQDLTLFEYSKMVHLGQIQLAAPDEEVPKKAVGG